MEKKPLIRKLKEHLKSQGKQLHLTELYSAFPEEKQTTIRGRLNENEGKEVKRVGKGLYISADTIIEHADILKRIDEMQNEGLKYDFVFLDIPYTSQGQKGGNRNIADFPTIEPIQFLKLVEGIKPLLTNSGSICFMITGGVSTGKTAGLYKRCFDIAGYHRLNTGTYLKLNKNGTECNIGQYLLPEEEIIIYSLNPELSTKEWRLNFREIRPNGYPTEKPFSMVKTLIEQATKISEWVLDPFGGSGVSLKVCQAIKRKCHIFDVSEKAVYEFILPIIKQTNII